jgi:hypothetical protein
MRATADVGIEPGDRVNAAQTRLCPAVLVLLLVSSFAILPACAFAQSDASASPLEFNIPAQPLANALVAYGTITGLEVFYNAALAEHRSSTAVVGLLTPAAALEVLLRGTGYVARTTGPGTFTILPERSQAHASAPSEAMRRIYQPYFATIQAQIDRILCRSAALVSGQEEMLFLIWLAPSGLVTRAEVIGEDGNPAGDQTFANALRGIAIGTPPAGMPQPVNLVIFPQSKISKACRPDHTGRGAG